MLHFLALKSAQNLLLEKLLYIVMGTRCDCGSIFYRCYDISGLYFVVVMMFMRNCSDCGFNFINFIKLKDLHIMGQKSFSVASQ